MTTRIKPTIDFSTFPTGDGEPMAETIENQIEMVELQFAFRRFLKARGEIRVAVGGNQFVYYNRRNGNDHCSPDVYVALDVAPGLRPTWKTWLEGKFPDIVFEITSPSTQDTDLEEKPYLYARLGALEYYIYDPQQALRPPLRGYSLSTEGPVLLPLHASGSAIHSPLLDAEMRIVGQYLRLVDPQTGEPFPTTEEVLGLSISEAAARQEADRRSAQAELALREVELARREAELHAGQAELARREAELRAAVVEERLREALVRLAQYEPPDSESMP